MIALYLFAALVALNIADVLTTLAIFHAGGHERNPYVDRIMSAIGVIPALLLTKGVPLAGMGYWLADVPVWALAVLCGWYVWVVAHNLETLKGLRA